ncbi:hypothetical protein [Runella sp.]|uniref:hypothetical protein n=1 Tax=Runella sp. TaxID=1960881 RepID=UPI003D09B593
MNELDKNKERRNLEKESVSDDKKSQKISAQTILLFVLIVGVGLMIFAYTSGYFTTGSEGNNRMGPVTTEDTTMVNKSDTIIGN